MSDPRALIGEVRRFKALMGRVHIMMTRLGVAQDRSGARHGHRKRGPKIRVTAEQRLAHFEEVVTSLRDQLAAKDRELETVRAVEKGLREAITERDRTIANHEQVFANLHSSIDHLEGKLSDYHAILDRPAIVKSFELGAESGALAVDAAVDRIVNDETRKLRERIRDLEAGLADESWIETIKWFGYRSDSYRLQLVRDAYRAHCDALKAGETMR